MWVVLGGRGMVRAACLASLTHAVHWTALGTAMPTGVCLSMLRPLHLPQQCCWSQNGYCSHATRAHFGAAHFFLLSLHCAHPSIVYSTQLQVRFRESVDLTFGVRPLWILVWCVRTSPQEENVFLAYLGCTFAPDAVAWPFVKMWLWCLLLVWFSMCYFARGCYVPAWKMFYCAITCISVSVMCSGSTLPAWFVCIGQRALLCVQFCIQLLCSHVGTVVFVAVELLAHF